MTHSIYRMPNLCWYDARISSVIHCRSRDSIVFGILDVFTVFSLKYEVISKVDSTFQNLII